MLIDWFTVIAQAINFLILVLLLRHFLYGRIVQAMDDREARLAELTENAEQRQNEAKAEIERYQRRQTELAAQEHKLLRQAETEAETRRKELVHQAREDVDLMRQRWQESLAQEQESFLKELRRKAGTATLALSRRTLADLADVSLDERLAAAFLAHLAETSEETWQKLGQTGSLEIASAHPLPDSAQGEFTHLVAERTSNGASLHFRVEPDLVGGMELRSPSYRIPWTLTAYLDEMKESFVQALEKR